MIRQELKRMLRVITTFLPSWVLMVFVIPAILFVSAPIHTVKIIGIVFYSGATFWITASCMVWMNNTKIMRIPTVELSRLVIKSYVFFTLSLIGLIVLATIAYRSRSPLSVTALLLLVNAVVTLYMLLPSWFFSLSFALILILANFSTSFVNATSHAFSSPISPLYLSSAAVIVYIFAWQHWRVLFVRRSVTAGWSRPLAENLSSTRSTRGMQRHSKHQSVFTRLLSQQFNPRKYQSDLAKMRILMGEIFRPDQWRNPAYWLFGIGAAAFTIFAFRLLPAKEVTPFMVGFQLMLFLGTFTETGLATLIRRKTQDITELSLLPSFGKGRHQQRLLLGAVFATTAQMMIVSDIIVTLLWIIAGGQLSLIVKMLMVVSASSLIIAPANCLFTLATGARYSNVGIHATRQTLVSMLMKFAAMSPAYVTFFFDNNIGSSLFCINSTCVYFLVIATILTAYYLFGYRWYRQLKALPHPFVEASS